MNQEALAHFRAGEEFYHQGNNDCAIGEYSIAIDIEAGFVSAYVMRGIAYGNG